MPNSKALRALEKFVSNARRWLDGRMGYAQPGWMVDQIDDVEAAIAALTAAEAHLASSTDVEGWRGIDSAPQKGEILIDLGETIPGGINARVASYISEIDATELGEQMSASGGWMIWTGDCDWFVVPYYDAHGWCPLPESPSPEKEGRG